MEQNLFDQNDSYKIKSVLIKIADTGKLEPKSEQEELE